jgi:hypothetical protein
VIQPSSGITFPDTSVQTTAFVAGSGLPTGGTVGQVLTKNSGSNFDASFQTLIPGDRYLTTSTTSLTIDNANKTLTVGTGLSYTSQQDVVIAYDAANHMHAQVLTYNSGTGVMTVDVRSHSGSGTFSLWTVNVGGTVPEASVSWGSITGTLGSQTDLATALNAKLEVTTAASTYFTIASAAGKANLSGATFTGKVNTTVTATTAPLNIAPQAAAPSSTIAGDVWIGANINYKSWDGIVKAVANTNTVNQFSQGQAISVNSPNNALRINQQGTGPALVVEDSASPDATPFVIDANGRVGIGVAPDTSAALKVDSNGIMFGDGTTQTTAYFPPPPSYSADQAIADMITASIINTYASGTTYYFDFRSNLAFGKFNFGSDVTLNGLGLNSWTNNSSGANGLFEVTFFDSPTSPFVISYKGIPASLPFGNFGY